MGTAHTHSITRQLRPMSPIYTKSGLKKTFHPHFQTSLGGQFPSFFAFSYPEKQATTALKRLTDNT